MEHITTEQKLELVKQIRSKYNDNICDMGKRERVLYGRSSYMEKDTPSITKGDRSRYYEENEAEQVSSDISFGRIRFLITVILIMGVITLDLSEKSLMGISMEQIFSTISQDYEEEIAAWASEIRKMDVETGENIP